MRESRKLMDLYLTGPRQVIQAWVKDRTGGRSRLLRLGGISETDWF